MVLFVQVKKKTGFVELLISLGIEEYDSAEPQIEVEAVNLRSPERRCNHEATWRERDRGGGEGEGAG